MKVIWFILIILLNCLKLCSLLKNTKSQIKQQNSKSFKNELDNKLESEVKDHHSSSESGHKSGSALHIIDNAWSEHHNYNASEIECLKFERTTSVSLSDLKNINSTEIGKLEIKLKSSLSNDLPSFIDIKEYAKNNETVLDINSVESSLTKINKFLYTVLQNKNQTIVLLNKTIVLQNISSSVLLENPNANHIGLHYFSQEPGWKQFMRSFILNFFSELGDKSFFCVVVFYNQVSPLYLFLIAVTAELLMNLFSVIIGYEMAGNFNLRFFKLLGMWIFFFLGLMTFYEIFFVKEEEEETKGLEIVNGDSIHEDTSEDDTSSETKLYVYIKAGMKVFCTILLAELGDKSQITTIILTTEYSPTWIFLGTAVAHIIGILISMLVGFIVSNKLNIKMINIIGAVAFLLFGLEMGIKYYRNPNDF